MRKSKAMGVCVLAVLLAAQAGYCADAAKIADKIGTGNSGPVMGVSARSFRSVSVTIVKTEPTPQPQEADVPKRDDAGSSSQDQQEAIQRGGSGEEGKSSLEMMLLLQELLAQMRKLTDKVSSWIQGKA